MTIQRLQLAHITKRYPSVVANSDVSLAVAPGETHAVLGENGAGKSTLMKIIYGAVKPDEGSVTFNGQPVSVSNRLKCWNTMLMPSARACCGLRRFTAWPSKVTVPSSGLTEP